MIDEEIRRLPERYREPLILCYLEGLRHHEIAERLDCPVGTVESRLSRGREQLRSRLVRRGLAPTAAIQGVLLVTTDASAKVTVSTLLVESTVRCVLGLASRRIAAEAVSVATLASAASWPKLGLVVSGLVACLGLVGGLGVYRSWAFGADPGANHRAAVALDAEIATGRPPAFPKASRPEPTPPPEPSRPDSAIAAPLVGIEVDGRLADWPADLARYPIQRRYIGTDAYDPTVREGDPDAYFQAGYDRASGPDLPGRGRPGRGPGGQGRRSHEHGCRGSLRRRPVLGSDDPRRASGRLEAAGRPVRRGPRPGRGLPRPPRARTRRCSTASSATRPPRWPTTARGTSRPTSGPSRSSTAIPTNRPADITEPGKRIGLDVVVVDKDPDREKPTWMHWGPTPVHFKGQDASLLGELILIDGP